jgi:two-component system, OmpR family, response regulator
MPNIKVLIADDEQEVLEIMEKKITAAGYAVMTAQAGYEAWDKIQRESPDVIVLDLMMPEIDGFTILKALREHPPSQKWQPVIIVSAKGELEDMKKGFSLEADHYITKPCRVEDILKAIKLMVSLIPQRIAPSEIETENN